MKIISKFKVCGCCGAKFEGSVCGSRYRENYGLDNKPVSPDGFPLIEQCPECGYCGFSIEDKVSGKVRETVESDAYKKILKAEYASEKIRLLHAMLLLTDSLEQSEYLHMLLCWAYEDAGQNEEAVKARKLAVGQMEQRFFNPEAKVRIPVQVFMVYFDCLRQLGEWEKLGKAIGEVEDDIRQHLKPEHLICRILEFEKNAMKNGDTAPHSIQEV